MAEGARLESVYTGNCIQGSNPCLSASNPAISNNGLYANNGGNPGIPNQLTTQHFHSESIVFEVAKAEGLSGDHLHFVVESLGDAIVAGEPPHAAISLAQALRVWPSWTI